MQVTLMTETRKDATSSVRPTGRGRLVTPFWRGEVEPSELPGTPVNPESGATEQEAENQEGLERVFQAFNRFEDIHEKVMGHLCGGLSPGCMLKSQGALN